MDRLPSRCATLSNEPISLPWSKPNQPCSGPSSPYFASVAVFRAFLTAAKAGSSSGRNAALTSAARGLQASDTAHTPLASRDRTTLARMGCPR
eukprot:scaffold20662_cov30-Prasinocladus_malaysianus.AAC.1